MLEKIQEALSQNGYVFESLEPLRNETAEIPVFELTCAGSLFEKWNDLKSLSPKTGVWPVDLPKDFVPDLIETRKDVVERRLEGCKELELPDALQMYMDRVNRAMLPEKRDGRHLTEDRCLPAYVLQFHAGSFVPTDHKEKPGVQRFVLIPAASSWEAFAYLTEDYANGMVKKDDPTPAAWVRRWEERYGAQLFVHAGSSLTFDVERPPAAALEAFRLMTELAHSGFGGDTIAQGFVSEQSYAAHLIGKTSWDFWWD